MEITSDIKYIGVYDNKIDLFEGQYKVREGISYNSYVVIDEKIAVFDTVDAHFKDEWFTNLKIVLNGKNPDYLIVNHMEPDHSGCIGDFVKVYKNAKVVATKIAFDMMSSLSFSISDENKVEVKEGDTLDLGVHKFTFIAASMVHWPEVMMTYDTSSKTLFSADAFGRFGKVDESDWADEARRYYYGIVGKYGIQVQNVLKKVASFDIRRICPLHGPILDKDLSNYINLYDKFSSYQAESDGVLLAYASIYGHTKSAIGEFSKELKNKGMIFEIVDLARDDFHECISKAFYYKNLLIASPTYNGDLFPAIRNFINGLIERNYQNRNILIVENGLWAPNTEKPIKKAFENSKNIQFVEPSVKIRGAVNRDNYKQFEELLTNF